MAFPTGWLRKCIISIPAAQISGNNTNFPVLITEANLPTEMVDGGANSALNGGGDVRLSEDALGAVQVPCYIPPGGFVTGSTPNVYIYARLPTVNTGADKTYYVWYNKSGEVQPLVTDTYGRNAVFSVMLAMYLPGYTNINVQGNATKDLTFFNSPTVVTGRNGKARRFNGTTQYAQSGSVFNSEAQYSVGIGYNIPSPITVSSNGRLFAIGDWGSGDGGLSIERVKNGSGFVYIMWRAANNFANTSTAYPTFDTWHNGHLTTDTVNTETKFYADSTNFFSNTTWSRTNFNLTELAIGRGNAGGSGVYMGADVDYFYVFNGVPSQSWITTEYNNQSNPAAFGIAGTPQAVGAPSTTVISATVAYPWATLQQVAQTSAYAWGSRNQVLNTSGFDWATRNQISQTSNLPWNMQGQIQIEMGFLWANIELGLSAITATVGFPWDCLQTITQTISAPWNTYISVAQAASLGWDLRELTTSQSVAPWQMLEQIQKETQAPWDMFTTAVQTANLPWQDLEQVQAQVQALWDEYGQVSGAITVEWATQSRVEGNTTLRWAVGTITAPTGTVGILISPVNVGVTVGAPGVGVTINALGKTVTP